MAHRGRPKSTPNVKCPDHPGTSVVSIGTRTTKAGSVRRRYRCRPANGKTHSFTVVEVDRNRRVTPVTDQPPPCSQHPGSHVIRWGKYATATGTRRQRYRCVPADESEGPHVFTPTLPRQHVHAGEQTCAICQETRSVHHGEVAFARRHRWPLSLVVQGLTRLATGESYAAVGNWALRRARASGRAVTERPSKTAWHIAADWTEAAAPVLFNHLTDKLNEVARTQRSQIDQLIAANEPVHQPQVVVVDDKAVNAVREGHTGRRRPQDGFYVLVVAELDWSTPKPQTRLRLARAMPTANTATWALTFDELGYTPDILISDGAAAISNAAASLFGAGTINIPSLYHIVSAISDNLLRFSKEEAANPHAKTRSLKRPLDEHLGRIQAGSEVVTTEEGWTHWWDDFKTICNDLRISPKRVDDLQRFHYPRLARSHEVFQRYPQIPASTGGVEALIRRTIHPLLRRPLPIHVVGSTPHTPMVPSGSERHGGGHVSESNATPCT